MKNYRDDFKIKFDKEPEFIVDKEKKFVKCYLNGLVLTPTGKEGQILENFRIFSKGYAKCSDKDKFNPEIGKKIALARAESRLYWKVKTIVKRAKIDAIKFLRGANKFIDKSLYVNEHTDFYTKNYPFPFENEEISNVNCTKQKNYDKEKCQENNGCCEKKNDNGIIKIQINRD